MKWHISRQTTVLSSTSSTESTLAAKSTCMCPLVCQPSKTLQQHEPPNRQLKAVCLRVDWWLIDGLTRSQRKSKNLKRRCSKQVSLGVHYHTASILSHKKMLVARITMEVHNKWHLVGRKNCQLSIQRQDLATKMARRTSLNSSWTARIRTTSIRLVPIGVQECHRTRQVRTDPWTLESMAKNQCLKKDQVTIKL